MESGGTQGNGEPIDPEERRAVGGDNAIEAAALQAAPKDIDGASDGNVWKHRSGLPFHVNQSKKKNKEKTQRGEESRRAFSATLEKH